MKKLIYYIKRIFDSVILAGVIILFIGLCYVIVKAGIPYQDPPLELQIKYAVNMGIGEELTKDGFWIIAFGGVARVLIGLILKRKDNKSKDEKTGVL